jgi:uracil-DNA glycosylase
VIAGRAMAPARPAPAADCSLCPRLAAVRAANRGAFPAWHNAPVASFGDPAATLLIVGLAPGLKGANRTGRPFTGDHAGIILYEVLRQFGFARGHYRATADDGLELIDCRITNAVRCVPPENRPLGGEVNACRQFLAGELCAEPAPAVILPLGAIAHASAVRALALRLSRHPFAHGAVYRIPGGPVLAPSYHCSRYNLNTGQLTRAMFEQVFATVRDLVDDARSGRSRGAEAVPHRASEQAIRAAGS